MFNNQSTYAFLKKHFVINLVAAVGAINSVSSHATEIESVTCMYNGELIAVGQTVKFISNSQRIRLPKNLSNSAYEVWECSEYKLRPSANDTFIAGVWVRRQSAK
jgi:hypothetical protein